MPVTNDSTNSKTFLNAVITKNAAAILLELAETSLH